MNMSRYFLRHCCLIGRRVEGCDSGSVRPPRCCHVWRKLQIFLDGV